MDTNESAPIPEATPKLPPESVALRTPPRPVTRLNRRLLIVLAGVLAIAVLGMTMWSLQPARRIGADASAERYNVDRITHAEALEQLPADYTTLLPPAPAEELPPDVPVLGEPLPGDLGAPMLRAEQEAQGYASPSQDPAEVERLAKLKEAEEAMRSPVFFGSGARARDRTTGPASNAAAASWLSDPSMTGVPSPPTVSTTATNPREAFLGSASPDARNSDALQSPASPYQVMAGTVIAAALVTGIRSDLPGDAIATVTEPVYDTATGRHLLIPQGSRLLGRYSSDVGFGQSRVQVVWHRIILPDTSSLPLDNLIGADPAGYAGLEDGVDRHWGRLVAGAALTTLLGVGAELAAPENRTDGDRIIIAGRDSAQAVISQVGQELTRRNLDMQSTLTIRAGMPLRVIVNRDLVLRPYQSMLFSRGGFP